MKILMLLVCVLVGVGAGLGARAVFADDAAPPAVFQGPPLPVVATPAPDAPGRRDVKEADAPLNPVFVAPLEVRGVVWKGKKINVVLSDGSVLTERDTELEVVERNSVRIAGKKYPIKPAPWTAPVEVVSVPRDSYGLPEVMGMPVQAAPVPENPAVASDSAAIGVLGVPAVVGRPVVAKPAAAKVMGVARPLERK